MARYTLRPDHTVPPTPFYYYDLELLRNTLHCATTEANRYGYHIHYALKANVEPRILQEIQQAGLGADCVSGYEVRCAVENGFDPQKIVFAGVGKSDHEIEYAIRAGIFAFNCESLQELEVINALAAAQGKTVNIALRINPNVQPKTHQYISTGQSESKFGISYTEIDTALARLHELEHIRIVSKFADEIRISNIIPKDSFSVNDVNDGLDLILSDDEYEDIFKCLVRYYFTDYTIIRNDQTLGFVRYLLIPTPVPIIINWNIGSKVAEQVCENDIKNRKINTFKCLVDGSISLSWNKNNVIIP